MKTTIRPTVTAGARTRNRLREHPGTVLDHTSTGIHGMGAASCALLRAPDGWLGWLPCSELALVVTP